MNIVNMHEAKTQLSKLVDLAVAGEPFVIAKAGKPLVKVTALQVSDAPPMRRRGFLAGQIRIPADFDDMAREEVEALFTGG